MSAAFLSELRVFPWDWAPKNWTRAQGQVLSIAQNTALFSLLGTTYGGNGQTTFALPDLRGRHALHSGQGPGLSPYSLGQLAGQDTVTLITGQMPQHTHLVAATSSDGTQNPPVNAYLARVKRGDTIGYLNAYAAPSGAPVVLGNMLSVAGGSSAHSNTQPSLVLNYCICTSGIFPSRN